MPELARDEQQNSAAARASAHAAEATDGKPRSRWSSHTTFLLASIGSAIGFGNVWRFPMMAYSYGGGAFMLPYLIALFFAAIPMVVLEFALGQRLQRGHVALVAHIAPRWEGLGWATVVGTFLSAQYYQTLLAYCLVYLVNAFRDPQPWAVEEAARSLSESSSSLDGAEASSGLQPGSGEAGGETEADAALAAVRSFWREEVLQVSSGVDETGGLVGPLCGWYALVWAVVCLGACDGASSIGALNKLLMPMPFAVLAAFFARAVTLPGAGAGIRTLFSPDFAAIWSPSIWVAAVSQLFFGVSAGLGTLTTYASFSPPSTPVGRSAIIVSLSNSAFSLFAGGTVFGFLGFISHTTGEPLESLVQSGPALAFQVFPIAMGLMPLPQLWAALFFLMLLNLGISSAVSMTSPLTTALCERFGTTARRVAPPLHLLGFVSGLIYVSRAGTYWLTLSDHFVPMFLTIVVGLSQCLLVSLAYGARRLLESLPPEDQRLAPWWAFCWQWLLPATLSLLLLAQVIHEGSSPFGGFPGWALAVGWVYSLGPLLLVPLFYCAHARAHGGRRGGGVMGAVRAGLELGAVRARGRTSSSAVPEVSRVALASNEMSRVAPPVDEDLFSVVVLTESERPGAAPQSEPDHAKGSNEMADG
mmetsp:Transcript_23959/g.77299  ORF Transcript_23959/g.77299 Transcript_23959/m.77299 type:complete len:644 (+) Transcript_23959:34-1965(+)